MWINTPLLPPPNCRFLKFVCIYICVCVCSDTWFGLFFSVLSAFLQASPGPELFSHNFSDSLFFFFWGGGFYIPVRTLVSLPIHSSPSQYSSCSFCSFCMPLPFCVSPCLSVCLSVCLSLSLSLSIFLVVSLFPVLFCCVIHSLNATFSLTSIDGNLGQ